MLEIVPYNRLNGESVVDLVQ